MSQELNLDALERDAKYIRERGAEYTGMMVGVDLVVRICAHIRDLERAQPAAANQAGIPLRLAPCKGMNCGCTDGVNHSVECQAEHAAAIAGGRFVK